VSTFAVVEFFLSPYTSSFLFLFFLGVFQLHNPTRQGEHFTSVLFPPPLRLPFPPVSFYCGCSRWIFMQPEAFFRLASFSFWCSPTGYTPRRARRFCRSLFCRGASPRLTLLPVGVSCQETSPFVILPPRFVSSFVWKLK